MIYLNSPLITGLEKEYLNQLFINKKFSGKGSFTHKSQDLLLNILRIPNRKALLTTSCTDALEMAAILANIKPGDEVIMPSFTFVSSANAFVLRRAKKEEVYKNFRRESISTKKSLLMPCKTGSFGENLIQTILKNYSDLKKVIICSLNELKQCEMSLQLSQSKYPIMRFVLGYVEDGARLKRACEGIDIKIHATHSKMAPLNITLKDSFKAILHTIENAWEGERFVRKNPYYKIMDAAKAVGPNRELKVIAIRHGHPIWDKKKSQGLKYNSGTNNEWVSVDKIRMLTNNHFVSEFNP